MLKLEIGTERLRICLRAPMDGFYQGTRFDRSGIFASALLDGVEMAAPWFLRYSPTLHDAVQGPAEEYTPVGFDEALPGGLFFKPGVGLLRRPDDAPYDHFRLYEVADPGVWEVAQNGSDSVRFGHRVAGWYRYGKEIALTGPASFVIRHHLTAEEHPLQGMMYNHNFWTMGNLAVGPWREIRFPFAPEGHWRSPYDSVALTPSGIGFLRPLREGESVFMGDLHASDGETPYAVELHDSGLSVRVSSPVPVSHMVFWANHRVACPEPFIPLSLAPGESYDWEFTYQLRNDTPPLSGI